MCVHAGTTANPAFAAFSVVNKPADLLPLDGIHEFFVVHGSIYPASDSFCRVVHEILEVSWRRRERPVLIGSDGYQFLEVELSTTAAAPVSNNWISGATLVMAELICVRKFSEDANAGCR